jgi:hypothetical protein
MQNELPADLANALVILSEAVQRNAKHEVRLSNISGYCWIQKRIRD